MSVCVLFSSHFAEIFRQQNKNCVFRYGGNWQGQKIHYHHSIEVILLVQYKLGHLPHGSFSPDCDYKHHYTTIGIWIVRETGKKVANKLKMTTHIQRNIRWEKCHVKKGEKK